MSHSDKIVSCFRTDVKNLITGVSNHAQVGIDKRHFDVLAQVSSRGITREATMKLFCEYINGHPVSRNF